MRGDKKSRVRLARVPPGLENVTATIEPRFKSNVDSVALQGVQQRLKAWLVVFPAADRVGMDRLANLQ